MSAIVKVVISYPEPVVKTLALSPTLAAHAALAARVTAMEARAAALEAQAITITDNIASFEDGEGTPYQFPVAPNP